MKLEEFDVHFIDNFANMEPSEKNNTVNQQSTIDPNKSNNEDPQMLQSSSASTSTTNATTLCVICSIRNRALALVPCGHFIVCVPCGHGLVVCPNCGTNIKALVRIYD